MTDRVASPHPLAPADARATVYVVALSLAAAWFLAWPIWRTQFIFEIWPTESWNAYLQDAAALGKSVYPPPQSLIGNNYPPLSFYAIGFIGRFLAIDNLFVGRGISVVALAALAVEVSMAVRILSGGPVGPAIAALWYLAIMARNSTLYIGTNDPQLAGLAIMGAGLVYFLRRCERQQSPMPALFLMVVSGFWKHNNIAVPLAAVSWLHITRSPYAWRATIISAAAMLLGLLACTVIFGSDFMPNLLAARQYAWSNVIGNVGHLQWGALAALIWAAWAIPDRNSRPAQFTALHIGFGLFACILQWFGHGVGTNAEFDLILALAIGIGVAFNRVEAAWLAKRIGSNPCRDVIVVALLLRLVLSDRQETALLLLSDGFRSSLRASERNVLNQAQAVAAMPGSVACATKLVCRLAGKPFVLDEFKAEELVLTGRQTPAAITARLEADGIRLFPRTGPTSGDVDRSISRWWRGEAN